MGREGKEREGKERERGKIHVRLIVVTTLILQSLQGVDYIIKDKLLPERILKMEFFSSLNMSTFYRGIELI